MDLGFHVEGIEILERCEKDPAAVATLRRNWGPDIEVCDADDWTPRYDKLDLIFGGPPCQPFSKAGKKRGCLDPRDRFHLGVRWARTLRPKLIVLETVAGVLTQDFNEYREWWWDEMDGAGYDGVMWNLMSADFGTPQLRNRVLFVAWQKRQRRLAKVLSEPPPVTHVHPRDSERYGLPVWVTGFQRLHGGCCGKYGYHSCQFLNNAHGLCETCVGGNNYQMEWENDNEDTELSEENIRYLLRRPDRVKKHAPADYSGGQPAGRVRGRLAPTVVANLQRGVPYGLVVEPDARFTSVKQLLREQKKLGMPAIRRMTVRENAKLQDCPQWYVFEGTTYQQYRQVGNAVPVNVARAVARQIVTAFGKALPKRDPRLGLWPMEAGNWACERAYARLLHHVGHDEGQLKLPIGRALS